MNFWRHYDQHAAIMIYIHAELFIALEARWSLSEAVGVAARNPIGTASEATICDRYEVLKVTSGLLVQNSTCIEFFSV